MSAFAVIFERSDTVAVASPSVFGRVMGRLNHRGPDGNDVVSTDRVIMGHWHLWTTPEENGERQPLELNGLPFRIVLDGRLDNRTEILTRLNISPSEGKFLSDAALIIHAYARWGEHCFERFIGEYGLVIFDQYRNEVICARDALGDRTLFYALNSTRLIIASEPWAVAGIGDLNSELNEGAVAHHFAMMAPEDGQTWLKDIFELLPGHAMRVNTSSEEQWCYWQLDPSILKRHVRKSDQEYAEEFRSILEESVRCRMRSITPVGVLMSGGLDSAPVACLAARMIAPQKLTTISYVFDELKDCDEREYIEAVKEKWDTHSIQILCDDAWPMKVWVFNPEHPEAPYRLLHERTYKCAHDEGLRVLMTGSCGDLLYTARMNWLADFILDRRFLDAFRALRFDIQSQGLRKSLSTGYLRRAARRLLHALPGGKYIHRGRKAQIAPEWLTLFSAGHLFKVKPKLDTAFSDYAFLLGPVVAQNVSRESFYSSRYALEIRDPFRDRRLIEFMLALPAYQLYSKGQHKYIMRTAMRGIVPDLILDRRERTSAAPLFLRGIERENSTFIDYFGNMNAHWRKFVRADWLMQKRSSSASYLDMDGAESVVRWLCVAYEIWHNEFRAFVNQCR